MCRTRVVRVGRVVRVSAIFFVQEGSEKKAEENYQATDETFGLESRKCPPVVNELKPFEDNLLKLIEKLEVRNADNDFQRNLRSDKK